MGGSGGPNDRQAEGSRRIRKAVVVGHEGIELRQQVDGRREMDCIQGTNRRGQDRRSPLSNPRVELDDLEFPQNDIPVRGVVGASVRGTSCLDHAYPAGHDSLSFDKPAQECEGLILVDDGRSAGSSDH